MPLKYKHRHLVSKSERQDGIVVLKKKMTLRKKKGQDDIFMSKGQLMLVHELTF
jgi:hypothetical protein